LEKKYKDWLIKDIPIPVYDAIKQRCFDLSCSIPKLFEMEFGPKLKTNKEKAWTIKSIDTDTIGMIQDKAKDNKMSVGRYLQHLMERKEDICKLEQKKAEYKERLIKEVVDTVQKFE
jgi:hypothetical protein